MSKILVIVFLLSVENIFSNPIDGNITRFFQIDESDPYIKEQKSLFQQLTTVCQEDPECLIFARFSSQFCVHSGENICQSDCKFFLKYISEEYANVCDQDQLDLPEDCVPPAWRNSSRCDELIYYGEDEPHWSAHFNVEFDKDEIHRIHVESKTVHSAQSAICYADDDLSKAITPGTIRRKSCNDLYYYVQGDIVQVCTNQGHLIQNRASCYADLDVEHLNEDTGVYRALTARENIIDIKNLTEITPYLENGKIYLDKVMEILANEKVQSLLPIAGEIASLLGPIGIAFSVALVFLPKPTSEEVKRQEEIMNSLKVLGEKSDQILDKVKHIKSDIREELLDVKLTNVLTKLGILELPFMWVRNVTDFAKSEMRKACLKNPGEEVVSEYHTYVKTKNEKYLAELFNFDRSKIINKFGKAIIGDTVRAFTMAMKCKSLDELATHSDLTTFAEKLQKLVNETVQKIQDIHDHYIPAHFAVFALETDIKEALNTGSDNYQELADNTYDLLSKKFDFYQWIVTVYEGTTDNAVRARTTDCFKCIGDKNSGSVFIENVKGKNLQVFYTNTEFTFPPERIIDIVKYNRRIDLTGVAKGLQNAGLRNALVVKSNKNFRVASKTGSKFYRRDDFQDLVVLTTA